MESLRKTVKDAVIKTAVEKTEGGGPKVTITSITKRIVASGIFTIGIAVAIGWAFGEIEPKDALIILSSVITGGFALLRL